MPTIAIQPDVAWRNTPVGSFSDRWLERAEQLGVTTKIVDVWKPDIVDQIRGCDGFMWRYMNSLRQRRLGKMLMAAVETGHGIPTFPSTKTGIYYEDKLAQKYALDAAEIPTPDTWAFYTLDDAREFARTADYPLVVKLATGYRSQNVALVNNLREADQWIRRMFGGGLTRLPPPRRKMIDALRTLVEISPLAPWLPVESNMEYAGHQQGYVLFQEFLPDNAFDTRITVVGHRAWGFRRHNRPNDFRSSGSGRIDHDPEKISPDAIRIGFQVAERLGTQALTMDGLRRGDEIVVGEISYSYHSQAVADCPGHWELDGPANSGVIGWVDGRSYSEHAIFDDFVHQVRGNALAIATEV